MNKSKFTVITLISLIAFSMCSSLVTAYPTEETTPVTIDSSGKFTGATNIGVGYEIEGTAGATGSVNAQVFNDNPQATASTPEGVSLTRFVVITFSMNPSEFSKATIYITYTDADVANLQAPYDVYKYVASTNSYVKLAATVDTVAKMITITVTSIDDPLFAIGGAPVVVPVEAGISPLAWVALAVSIAVIVVLTVVGVWY